LDPQTQRRTQENAVSWEDIPFSDSFKHYTSHKKSSAPVKWVFTGRGSELAAVDSALREWDHAHVGDDDAAKRKVLNHIVSACVLYLKRNGSNKGPLAKRRKKEVERVYGAAMKAVRKRSEALYAFQQNKAKAQMRPEPLRTVKMNGIYAHERESYVRSGKEFAVGATPIASFALAELNREDVSAMTFREFAEMYNEYSHIPGVNLQVTYLSKAQRLDYLAIPHDGIFFRADGTPVQSTSVRGNGARDVDVWSMDR